MSDDPNLHSHTSREDDAASLQAASSPRTVIKHNRSAQRKWLFRFAAMTLIPALFLIVLELGLRLFGFGYPTGFFVEYQGAGEKVRVENLDFGRRFFPEGLARAPLPLAFPAQKRAGTYRIFILGESAAMGFPGPSFSFGRILETMLREQFPHARFEVINTSMTAINSHVILPIARDCAAQQSDLFVVYMGNNEVVGPFGASGVLGRHSSLLPLVRANILVKSMRIGQLLTSLLEPRSSGEWDGMTMFAQSELSANDPRLDTVYSQFRRNLDDICAVGRRAGAEVVVCTVATNVRELPPFASRSSPDLTGRQASEWQRHFDEGVLQEERAAYVSAVENYEQAAAIDGQYAALQFRLARCLLALERPAEARHHYLLARDCDTLRFRADSTINAAIRGVAADWHGDGVYLADVVGAVEEASPHGLPGNELFHEHVHLTFAGNYLLARTVYNRVAAHLLARAAQVETIPEPLSEQACQERLAFTDWNRLNSCQAVGMLFAQPPFSGQLGSDARNAHMQREIEMLQRRLMSGGFDKAITAYHRAFEHSEHDAVLHMDFGFLLMSQGRAVEAASHFQIVQQALPHHPAPHVLLAHAYAAQNRFDEAIACCADALRLKPGWPQAIELLDQLRSLRN